MQMEMEAEAAEAARREQKKKAGNETSSPAKKEGQLQ